MSGGANILAMNRKYTKSRQKMAIDFDCQIILIISMPFLYHFIIKHYDIDH